jgi:DNA mismatch repair protein MutL
MAKITVLDEHMVNMIAAGEVIERPASVVKELLENSIDAGAKNITLEVDDGGRKLIRVVDDGWGMDEADLMKAFLPHATSKIKTADDLMKISTMGFRGEALASIGSVAKVSITSRQADSIGANVAQIDCGQNQQVKPASGSYGTTIEVHNLFYKLPARRKFLKSANTEIGHITEQFIRVGLARRDIAFTLIHNGRKTQMLTAGETLSVRINKLFSNFGEDLLDINGNEKGVKISGAIGTPASAKGSGKYQYIFLNGRFIRDKFIGHAIKEAYRGLIEPSRFPTVFLFLEMDCESFDVNVHPTKVEVRFDNPNMIHSQVMAVIREKLMSANIGAMANFQSAMPVSGRFDEMPESGDKQRIQGAIADFFQKHKSDAQPKFNFNRYGEPARPNANSVRPMMESESLRQNFYEPDAAGPKEKIIQLHNSYMVVETDEGFEIIDQHALHERILYEKMLSKISSGALESQRLLMPACIEVDEAKMEIISENGELFKKMGIEIEEFGPGTAAVQSFPVMLEKVDPIIFVVDLLDILSHAGAEVELENLVHEVLDMAACKAAIKAGQVLSQQEMLRLLESRKEIERSSNCPHGRPASIRFSLKELEKQFKRL